MRMGKLVKDRAPKTDEPVLKQMMTDMKTNSYLQFIFNLKINNLHLGVGGVAM